LSPCLALGLVLSTAVAGLEVETRVAARLSATRPAASRAPVAFPEAPQKRVLPAPEWAQVSGATVNVRGGPGTDSAVVAVLRGGDFVRALAEVGGWYEIEWPASVPAWIARDFVKPDGTVTATRVRIRAAANTSALVLREANPNERVEILESAGGWYKIKAPPQARAYISARYVILGVRGPATEAAQGPRPSEPAPQAKAAPPQPPPAMPVALKPGPERVTEPVAAQPAGPGRAANRPPQIELADAGAAETMEPSGPVTPEPSAAAQDLQEPMPEPADFDPAPDALEDLAPPAADAFSPTPSAEEPVAPLEASASPAPSAPAAEPVAILASAQASVPPPLAPEPAAPQAFGLPTGEKEEPARAPTLAPSVQEPAIVVVPTRLRAAADEDELGRLLPPPRYIKEQARPEEVPAAGGSVTPQAAQPAASPLVIHIPAPPDSAPLGSSAAPALPTPVGPAPEAQRCPAPMTTQVRSFEAGRLALVSGVLEPAFSSPYKGVSHRVVQGSTTVAFLMGARPELNLAQFAGRRVEVLGVLSESTISRGDQLLQVSAVHPLD
jgi:SH3-like domain-containing protein